jgi:uncharacterized protein (DUF1778 family)
MAQRTNRTEKLDLRLTPAAKQALRQAAESSRESVSDFVLRSALARADEILADHRVIKLDDAQVGSLRGGPRCTAQAAAPVEAPA